MRVNPQLAAIVEEIKPMQQDEMRWQSAGMPRDRHLGAMLLASVTLSCLTTVDPARTHVTYESWPL